MKFQFDGHWFLRIIQCWKLTQVPYFQQETESTGCPTKHPPLSFLQFVIFPILRIKIMDIFKKPMQFCLVKSGNRSCNDQNISDSFLSFKTEHRFWALSERKTKNISWKFVFLRGFYLHVTSKMIKKRGVCFPYLLLKGSEKIHIFKEAWIFFLTLDQMATLEGI